MGKVTLSHLPTNTKLISNKLAFIKTTQKGLIK